MGDGNGANTNASAAPIQVGGGKVPPQVAEVYFQRMAEKPDLLEALNAWAAGSDLTAEQQAAVQKHMLTNKGTGVGAKEPINGKGNPPAAAAPVEAPPQPMEIDAEILWRVPLADLLDIALARLNNAVREQFPKGVLLAIFVSKKKIQVAPAMMNKEGGLQLDDKVGASTAPDSGGGAIDRVLGKVIKLTRGSDDDEGDDEGDEDDDEG